MSWTIPFTGEADDLRGAVEAAHTESVTRLTADNGGTLPDWYHEPETTEQIQAALAAAEALSTAALQPTGYVTVTLAGHANPGHQPTQGWANDYVSVSVTQAPVSVPSTVETATNDSPPFSAASRVTPAAWRYVQHAAVAYAGTFLTLLAANAGPLTRSALLSIGSAAAVTVFRKLVPAKT